MALIVFRRERPRKSWVASTGNKDLGAVVEEKKDLERANMWCGEEKR